MIKKLDIKNGGVEDLLNCIKKINELVDAVNQLVSCEQARTCYELIHKNKTPAGNVLTKSLRMDKEFAEEEMERLQKENSDLKDEVEKLQKQLERAKSHLNCIKNNYNDWTPDRDDHMRAHAANCLAEIKELEDGNL